MAEDSDAQIIRDFARDISARLDEAAIIARTANGFGKEGCSLRPLPLASFERS